MRKYELVNDMFPDYLGATDINVFEDKIIINFKSKRNSCICPTCKEESNIKSTYFTRTMQDLNIIEKPLFLLITLAKYRCENTECNTKIFCETIEDFAGPKQRRTNRLNDLLTKFALTHSAESAARRCNDMHIKISGDTLLRISKRHIFNIDKTSIEAIGIDDFAFKKNILMEQL